MRVKSAVCVCMCVCVFVGSESICQKVATMLIHFVKPISHVAIRPSIMIRRNCSLNISHFRKKNGMVTFSNHDLQLYYDARRRKNVNTLKNI